MHYRRGMDFELFAEQMLEELSTRGRLRLEAPPSSAVNLCSNDYLGLGAACVSRETSSPAPAGSGASRHVYGTHPAHLRLEHELCGWLELPAAVLFASGYAANLGLLQAVATPECEIFSDELNHASIVDGCRLAKAQGARVTVYPHLQLRELELALQSSCARHRVVVSESYFSMDGDSPGLPSLSQLCERYDAWLFVDEAHALGVFGARGRGLCARDGVRPHALLGTLGKAFGLSGAFVAGSTRLRALLWNRARPLIYSTGPSPWLAELALQRLELLATADREREVLVELEQDLRESLHAAGFALPPDRHGPIFPILVGSAEQAVKMGASLLASGFAIQAIRPPTVPEGGARLRVTLNARLEPATLRRLVQALCEARG